MTFLEGRMLVPSTERRSLAEDQTWEKDCKLDFEHAEYKVPQDVQDVLCRTLQSMRA